MSATDDFIASYQKHQNALANANTLNRAALFDALSSAGITAVTVTFDGEGDSGQIEDLTASVGAEPAKIPSATVAYRHVSFGAQEPVTSSVPISEAIENLCYDFLEIEHAGWENNDGAFGDFTFDVAQRQIDLVFNARFSDFTTSSYTF